MNNKLKKVVFLISLLLILILPLSKNYIVTNLDEKVYNNNLISNIVIGNSTCVLNKEKTKCYYMDDSNLKKNKIKVKSIYKDIKFYVLNNSIIVYNDEFYQTVDVVTNSISIINIHNLSLDNVLKNHTFEVKNINDFVDIDNTEEINIPKEVGVQFVDSNNYEYNLKTIGNIKVRGSSSQSFDKKSYLLSFQSKQNILGLPSDDKFVLDALYVDKSKVRNALSTAMWDLINNNQNINNDLSYKFVEVYIDDDYRGLYVLKDKVDSSVTKINNDGVLLKSIGFLNEDYINHIINGDIHISNNTFLNYEIKKGNMESVYALISKLNDYYMNNSSYDAIDNNFELDNYINFKIFIALISGNDNVSYNQYYSTVNQQSKILITPWDMDLTWGLVWMVGNEFFNEFILDSSTDIDWLEENIMYNLDYKTAILLKKRYWELRKNIITMDTINKYLDYYKALLVDSGASIRDSGRWYEYDLESEIEQIRIWADKRIECLDEYFKI